MKPEAAAVVAAPGVKLRSWRDQQQEFWEVEDLFFFFLLPTNNPVFPINTPRPGLRLFIS